jgi:hypothetical protein
MTVRADMTCSSGMKSVLRKKWACLHCRMESPLEAAHEASFLRMYVRNMTEQVA